MSIIYRAYYDRNDYSINGLFTLQAFDQVTGKLNILFHQLPARSGQKGFTNTQWVSGKSPIPSGHWMLWLKPQNPGTWPGEKGVGEFFPISSTMADKTQIVNPEDGSEFRTDIGLHPENGLPGSAGCVVLVVDTPQRKDLVTKLFLFLQNLGKDMEHIEFIVL